jgi:Ohr subfamily peroxiredoxin
MTPTPDQSPIETQDPTVAPAPPVATPAPGSVPTPASASPVVLERRLYTATAIATGGRSGRARSDDGALDVAIVRPRELGGTGEPGTNPEQLFAAGYAACFGSALATVAGKAGVELGTVEITARVALGPVGRGFGLAVELVAALPDLPRDRAEELLAAAHRVCPYSNATRGNIEVDLRLA